MIKFFVMYSVLMVVLVLPPAGQSPGSISGTVVATGTATPVSRATVKISRNGSSPTTLTATAAGQFIMPDAAPGEYRITASREGYVANSRGATATVVSGRKTDVTVEIVPDGVIIGRVIDWDGIPVVGSQVQAMKFTQDGQGQRTLVVAGTEKTNDLGEYRIYWLPPGPYLVNASPVPPQWIPTYFPDSVEVASAMRIDVRAGETFSGADIRLRDQQGRRISGVVTNPTGRSGASIRLTSKAPVSGFIARTATADPVTGVFRLDNIAPGEYIVTAECNMEGVVTFGRTSIEVGDKNLENVGLTLTSGFDLRVRMTIEGRQLRGDDPPLVVNLRPAISWTPFPTVMRDGEDRYVFQHVMPGDYSVAILALTNMRSLNGPPLNESFYMKSAQLGGIDVLSSGLHVDGTPSAELQIVMADGAVSLSGSVLDEKRQPASGVTVVLVPEARFRSRADLYKTAMTDTSGKFTINGMAPGLYKAFSWDPVGKDEWLYPDFINFYEDRGQSVRLESGHLDPVTIMLIQR